MKRLLVITTIALSTAGVAGCGSADDQAESAGKSVGTALAQLQNTVMTRPAGWQIDGIDDALQQIKGDVPADVYEQLTTAEEALRKNVTAATNHPEALATASQAGVESFTSVSGSSKTLDAFKSGVKQGYADGTD